MYSTRPYRKKLPLDTVVAEIRRVSGTQLSPRVVDAFVALVDEGAFANE
jgi:energy-coupling factor transport system substrate-specific component